jgi:hydroxyacyl-ACP dehydratase HTD2-like protein with hotdog domain
MRLARKLWSARPLILGVRTTRLSSTLSSVADELKSRPQGITYDYLSPTPSHLLDVSLQDLLPTIYPVGKTFGDHAGTPLPQGHHMVYFRPAVPHHQLLPDGCDTLHSPSSPTPFTRRMWAGGSVSFDPSANGKLLLDCQRAACVEGIRDVSIKGRAGEEKIFVHIERRYGLAGSSFNDESAIEQLWKGNEAAVVEQRNLVFLREPSTEEREAKAAAEKAGSSAERLIKPQHVADMRIPLLPPASLLFRFSALTFNAHRIHLDPGYSREVEGHRNILVHGPLTLVLMLTVLRSQLREGECIRSFNYRNLAPLYADEQMHICVKRDVGAESPKSGARFDVWIEGAAGGYAVKGSAVFGSTT